MSSIIDHFTKIITLLATKHGVVKRSTTTTSPNTEKNMEILRGRGGWDGRDGLAGARGLVGTPGLKEIEEFLVLKEMWQVE